MKKVSIETDKKEVVQTVKLTLKQRVALIEMNNKGGRSGRNYNWPFGQDEVLVGLGLIERRPELTEQEKKDARAQIAAKWSEVTALVKARESRKIANALHDIDGLERRLAAECYWLTKAAREYLIKGKVTVCV